jgi:hypothetical protein
VAWADVYGIMSIMIHLVLRVTEAMGFSSVFSVFLILSSCLRRPYRVFSC